LVVKHSLVLVSLRGSCDHMRGPSGLDPKWTVKIYWSWLLSN